MSKTLQRVINTDKNERGMEDLTMYLEFQAVQYRRGLLTIGQMRDQLDEFEKLYILRILEVQRGQVRESRGW